MNEEEKSKGFSLKEMIVIIIITAFVTSMTTGLILYNQNKLTKNITYQDLNNDEELKEFLNVYASLIDQYYEDVDKKGMLESAIGAMLNYLGEDYSTYMSKEETDALAQKLMGEYKGIGIEVTQDNVIAGFIEGGSAQEVGLEEGDKIIAINGNVFPSNDEQSTVADYLKNRDVGETVTISVTRGNETLNYEVEVRKLILSSIDSQIFEDHIGYLKIATFSNNLKMQVEKELETLKEQNIDTLILDLRNNTGGYLSSAGEVASLFIEKGKTLYSLEEKEETKEFKDETEQHENYKIVVLQNEATASASEVLIAALKESYGITIVGTTSYGKGRVQQTYSLDDGTMVKYTSARWLTPNGNCIDQEGIAPDYLVLEDKTDLTHDAQLEKALEVIQDAMSRE